MQAATEGWILAGALDGARAYPALDEDVAGLPYLLRLACDLVHAGCTRIHVLWSGPDAPDAPDAQIIDDPRLRGAPIAIAMSPPSGADDDAIVIVRADRIYHRDIPRHAHLAWKSAASGDVAVVDGHDAALVTTRERARHIAAAAPEPAGLARLLGELEVVRGAAPYLTFTARARDARELRAAERRLVWSLRKAADGIASKLINRRISLPVTWLLMRTPVHPNVVTVLCSMLAVSGAAVIAQGGYIMGAVGMLIFNLGSILDGVDGELARLKYWQSRVGQWLDTVADDFGNVAYITGIMINLDAAGVSWAVPVGITALGAFALTQVAQYALIALVYKSGDLAAIPWLFQSTDFLSAEKPGVLGTIPKLFKRDFALTAFVVFACLGWLHVILLFFATSALSFICVFAVQFARNARTLRTGR